MLGCTVVPLAQKNERLQYISNMLHPENYSYSPCTLRYCQRNPRFLFYKGRDEVLVVNNDYFVISLLGRLLLAAASSVVMRWGSRYHDFEWHLSAYIHWWVWTIMLRRCRR